MNRLILMSITLSFLLILTGCHHEKDKKSNTISSISSHAPTTVISTNTGDTGDVTDIVSCEANPSPITKFVRVHVTYGLLVDGPFIPGETQGLLPLTITSPVSEGDNVINVESTLLLVEKQLLTYLGTNGRYSVGQIKSTTATTITLEKPVIYDIAADENSLSDFYQDASHPNLYGSRALADFAFDTAYNEIEANKVHVLLGDSWFKFNETTAFADRLQERLPSGSVIQNEGIGGHSLCGLLGRVDNIIDTYNPDYVWISSSINDLFDGVTQEQYKARMQTLISKVQATGAIAIVMDPAPGPLNQSTDDGTTFTTLSQRYATQILDLLAETEVQ